MRIFRVGIFWMEIIWGDGSFPGGSFPDTRFVLFIKVLLSLLLRHLDFLPAFILKTLGFQYKHQVIFGRSVSCSLLYSVSFFYIYLLLKSRFHFFFGSNLKKILWECSYLEVLCRIIVIPNGLCLWKSFAKEFKNYFLIRKIREVHSCFDKRNNCFSGQLFLWNSFRECFGFKTALRITRSNRMITDWETQT